jgi:hypothetical protein
MQYHLSQNGQNVGTFELEELRRRRDTGELAGGSLVWCPGMAGWQTLDTVLGPRAGAAAKRRNKAVIFWIAFGVLFALIGVGVLVVAAVRVTRLVKHEFAAPTRARLEAVDIASKPIVVGIDGVTEKTVQKRGGDFRSREYLEAYKTFGRRNAPCDAEAVKFLEAWITTMYGKPLPTNSPSLQTMANKLAAQVGCDDPVVLTIAGAVCNEGFETKRRFEKAVAAYAGSKYKAYPQFYATVGLGNQFNRDSGRWTELDRQALNLLKKALADGSLTPADSPDLAESFVNGWGSGFFKRNGQLVTQLCEQAKGFEWLALVCEGEYQRNEAWRSRGSGYADTVSKEGWKGFADHLVLANVAFSNAWKLDPRQAIAPATMISVSMGQGGEEEMRVWFDRATSAQIDYPEAWSLMRWGLRPRWHGSQEALLALGRQAVDTGRFDTDVPRKYFDSIRDVEAENELAAGKHIYGRSDVWPYLRRMYEGYIGAAPDKANAHGWRSTYAAIAYMAGKHDVARRQLEAIDWNPAEGNLQGYGLDLSMLAGKVAALTSQFSNEVAQAETKADQADLTGAVTIYETIGKSKDVDSRTREYAESRVRSLKQEQALARGEWIDFLPGGPGDPNWVMLGSHLQVSDDGSVEVKTGEDGHSFYSRTRVGSEFEVTGEFDVVSTSNGAFQAGIMFGMPDSYNSVWYAFRVKQNDTEGHGVSYSRGWGNPRIWETIALDPKHNTFQFRFQNGRADAWVNGTQVLKRALLRKDINLGTDCLIGLGAYHDSNDTVIRYKNVKVRRLAPGT